MKKKVKYRLLIFGAIILIGIMLKGNIPHEPFNSEKWKTADFNKEENWSLRWDMMNSLRNKHELKGKTKAEIINLLGEPDWKDGSDFSYGLGPSKRGISMGFLKIKFNGTGIATDFIVGDG